MGLKEEMAGDIEPAAHEARARGASVSVRKKAEVVDTKTHFHGDGKREEAFFDDDGKRRLHLVQGRIPKYQSNCKACLAEDKARMEKPAPEHDFDSTVFLIPELAPDSHVAQEYLARRYPGIDLAALSTIRPGRLAIRKGASIVVVTRRTLPGEKFVGPSMRTVEDKRGDLIEQAVPPSEHIAEIVESAPVSVDDCVTSTAATMFSDAQVDLSELAARLSDLAGPRYFIAQYQRVPGSDEIVFTMRRYG